MKKYVCVPHRCFLSGGSPASSPSLSRVVETICIRLCDKITQPRTGVGADGQKVYISRWRCLLEAYNQVRSRVFNSQRLLEGTNLALFALNETTLVKWYKNTQRRTEIKLLLQGLELPQVEVCARDTLPAPRLRPHSPEDMPMPQVVLSDKKDTSGQAQVRRRAPPSCTATTAAPIDAGLQPMAPVSVQEAGAE